MSWQWVSKLCGPPTALETKLFAHAQKCEENSYESDPVFDQLIDQLMLTAPLVNHFKVLGVPFTAAKQEILQRHRALALEHHPDRGGHSVAPANEQHGF